MSTDSTWLPLQGAAAAANDDSESEWSALEARARHAKLCYGRQDSGGLQRARCFWTA